jgi:xylulose-5-phosphate/fructose-6-phosphate phosphoketolase
MSPETLLAPYLGDRQLDRLDLWWRAANYLSVGQIYLLDNPLLREPLRAEHVKPRLLGHWGTTPGLNLLYAHLNRLIVRDGFDALFVTGPGHGGPGLVANTWLEGSYSVRYPDVSQDAAGMSRLFRQFSFPGGIPSHVAPETPGSIHEGGELGYALSHAYGAAFDNPELLVMCVVGDGEAETGPLATSWHSNKFVDPSRDGATSTCTASGRRSRRWPPHSAASTCSPSRAGSASTQARSATASSPGPASSAASRRA